MEEAWDELSQHVDKIIEKQNWDEAIDYLLRFAEKFPIPVNQRLMHIYKNNSDTENLNRIRKWLAAMYREGDLLDESLQLYRDYLDDHPGDQSVIKEIHELENAIGIPHFTETPLGGGDDDFEGDLITPELLTENGTVPEENDTQLPELTLLHDEIDLGGGTEDEPVMSKTAQDISPEEFAGKKEEADFYAQQGIYDEAIKIYELLVLSFPDNEEIRHELASLKSRTGETLDIVVEKISGQENEAGEDRLALQDEYNQIDLMGDVDQEEATEDFERYYNAGVDFREKGLMEDAIRALQIASRDPDNMQRNAKLLATCYLEIGSYPLAIAEFHKIIEKMSSEDEGFIDLQYDLAGAYAENRDYHKAFEMYEEINERSPQFRDVTDKIDALREQMVTDADRPKTKKDRVSYI